MNQIEMLTLRARIAVVITAIIALMFDGMEMGLMPIASNDIVRSMLGAATTKDDVAQWFAAFTAALMFGAATGGILLGNFGDRYGRARSLAVSLILYATFAWAGGYVSTLSQLLLLRFLVGLGLGGIWPSAVSLVAECLPDKSRPVIAGVLGSALNGGILVLSQLVRIYKITPDHWQWVFNIAAIPFVLGLAVLFLLPESPIWLAKRKTQSIKPVMPLKQLLMPPLRRLLIVGILLGGVPLIGAWGASKWVLPWASDVGAAAGQPGYKATTQACWAFGAVLGSFCGSQVAVRLGRRLAYGLISIGATICTLLMFLATAPMRPEFLWIVGLQGFVGTLFFGWLPLYLPELFPAAVRASGAGAAFNIGRFATAGAVLLSGQMFQTLGGTYSRIGATCGLVYVLGVIVIWFAPDTQGKDLRE
jgi:MFS family permease